MSKIKQKQPLLIGAHMSIAGGYEKAIERGESIGCTAIQIFTKSNRQWGAKEITTEEASLFKKTAEQSSIRSIIAHASYLINLGSPDATVTKKSVTALIHELQRCDQLEIPFLVLHPGSCLELPRDTCLQQIIHGIDHALETAVPKTMLLLETMACQGSSVCGRFEEIATVINSTKYLQSIGVCLDTCHVFAAGYDLRDPKSYEHTFNEFDRIIGLKKLKAFHFNDSKKGLGSHVDRHEDIGKGELGLEAFRLIMNDDRFKSIPKILETPATSLEDYEKNLIILKSLVID
jgi:deoxyribonuclease-4